MTKRNIFCVVLFFMLNQTIAQVVFEPTYHTVYPFLSRLSQKGVISLDDVILPLSKDYIYAKLDELSKKITELTPLEREELSFYLKEYTLWWRNDPKSGFDGEYKSIFASKFGDRFRTFAYQNKDFTINIQPIIGFQGESRNGFSYTRNWKGFWTYGYLGKHIGYSLDFRSSQETGRLEDYQRVFSPETGVIGTKTDFKTFNYNESNVAITGSWNWGKITVGKNYLPIGYGQGSKLIISEKSPSFPQIRLDVNPIKWLSFNYAHIWLNSLEVDSSSIRSTSVSNRQDYRYRDKYLVTHSVTLKPISKLSLTVGESAIYTDKLRIEYLIPISLFSAMSHYMGELTNNSISNSSIYSQISARNVIKNTHLYGSFFIDELRLNPIENDSSSRNHTAYQIGLSITDLPFKNLFFVFEYTKIQPFAYIHFINAQSYQNNGYNVGSWIGPNSDQVYLNFIYRIRRGLELNLAYEYIRKGAVGTGAQQVADSRSLFPFLWGDLNEYEIFNSQLQYELIHDLFFKLGYKHQRTTSTKTASQTTNDHMYFSISFGF